jgi:hypothetical protein
MKYAYTHLIQNPWRHTTKKTIGLRDLTGALGRCLSVKQEENALYKRACDLGLIEIQNSRTYASDIQV